MECRIYRTEQAAKQARLQEQYQPLTMAQNSLTIAVEEINKAIGNSDKQEAITALQAAIAYALRALDHVRAVRAEP